MTAEDPKANPDELSAALARATRAQKRKVMLAVTLFVLSLAGAALFYVTYSAPRERKKKYRRLTQTAWTWYAELGVCLGGPGTTPKDPTEIYRRAVLQWEDDPDYLKRAKGCGQAIDITRELERLADAKPTEVVDAELTPLLREVKTLGEEVTKFVGMTTTGPTKGEDTRPLYDALWATAARFERLHAVVGLPSPLKPVATLSDGIRSDAERLADRPPNPTPPTKLDLGASSGLGVAATALRMKDGLIPVTWAHGIESGGFDMPPHGALLVRPAGGQLADLVNLAAKTKVLDFSADRECGARGVALALTGDALSLASIENGKSEIPWTKLPTVSKATVLDDLKVAVLESGKSLWTVKYLANGAATKPTLIAEEGKFVAAGALSGLAATKGAGNGAESRNFGVLYRRPAEGGREVLVMRFQSNRDGGAIVLDPAQKTSMEPIPADVPSPGCIAGNHIWFGARETGYHSDDRGKSFRKFVIPQPRGGGLLTEFICTDGGALAAVYRARNEQKRGIWVATCLAPNCASLGEPAMLTHRRALDLKVLPLGPGRGWFALWSEARRIRGRYAANFDRPDLWGPSFGITTPESYTEKSIWLGAMARGGQVLSRAGDAAGQTAPFEIVTAWVVPESKSKESTPNGLYAIASRDFGATWGAPESVCGP